MKYKVGDKVVMEITDKFKNAYGHEYYSVLNSLYSTEFIDEKTEPLSTHTEPLEMKNENKQKRIEKLVDRLHNQAAEITRLLEENKRLKAENGNNLWNTEQARAEGQKEAWELARKCMLMTDREREAIFGSGYNALYGVLTYFDYNHAAAKVAEQEKAKEEIKAGDIVESNNGNGERIAVIDVWPSFDGLHFEGISSNRTLTIDASAKYYTKTGRHIDIDGFLKQIRGEQE